MLKKEKTKLEAIIKEFIANQKADEKHEITLKIVFNHPHSLTFKNVRYMYIDAATSKELTIIKEYSGSYDLKRLKSVEVIEEEKQ